MLDELIKLAVTPERLTISSVAVLGCVAVWRLYVNFRKEDRVSQAENDLRDDLFAHNKELIQRADKASAEALEAARREGAVNGELAAARAQMSAYSRRCPYARECGIPKND